MISAQRRGDTPADRSPEDRGGDGHADGDVVPIDAGLVRHDDLELIVVLRIVRRDEDGEIAKAHVRRQIGKGGGFPRCGEDFAEPFCLIGVGVGRRGVPMDDGMEVVDVKLRTSTPTTSRMVVWSNSGIHEDRFRINSSSSAAEAACIRESRDAPLSPSRATCRRRASWLSGRSAGVTSRNNRCTRSFSSEE